MVKRIQCMSMLCVGSLIVSTAQASQMENITGASVPVASTQSNNLGLPSAIDQDLMNIVGQVMYGKTPGQVIDELVYTYGNGAVNTVSLAAIAQRLSEQLGYLNLAIESAQAIVAVLPPASPHLVAAKLIINELSVFITCIQTVLAQIQNAQATAPAAAPIVPTTGVASTVAPAVTAAAPTASGAPAPGSAEALASAAISLFGDIASAIAASHTTPSSNAPAATSSITAPAPASNTHHHGSHTSW